MLFATGLRVLRLLLSISLRDAQLMKPQCHPSSQLPFTPTHASTMLSGSFQSETWRRRAPGIPTGAAQHTAPAARLRTGEPPGDHGAGTSGTWSHASPASLLVTAEKLLVHQQIPALFHQQREKASGGSVAAVLLGTCVPPEPHSGSGTE